MSQITINVMESESTAVDDGGTGTITPGTGVSTMQNTGSSGTTMVGVVAVVLLVFVAILVVVKRHRNIKIVAGRSRWLAKGLALLAIVAAASSFSLMQTRYDDKNVEAVDNNDDSLSVSTEDIVMSVEMTDEPVYAMVANKVIVNAATYAGYVLSAYATNANLVASGSDGVIASLETGETRKLSDNTWGVASELPENQDSEVFFGLSADANNPTTMKETNEVTETGDESTFYYGTYVTPELPYGAYTGATINYVAVANFDPDAPVPDEQVGVVFDGNDMEFDNGQGRNRANYEEKCGTVYAGEPIIIKTDNIDDDGGQHGSYTGGITVYRELKFEGARRLEIELKYDFTDNVGGIAMNNGKNWFGYPIGYEDGLTSLEFNMYGNEMKIDGSVSGNGVPPRDYGYYMKITPIYVQERAGAQEVERCFFERTAGDYKEPARIARYWLSNDGTALYGEEGVTNYLDDHKDEYLGGLITITAYSPNRIVYNGNGATVGTMDGFYSDWPLGATSGEISLMAPNFYKDGYGFVGWSENPNALTDGNSRIYGPNERVDIRNFTFDAETHEKTLYAVWAPSEGTLQGFDGCSAMDVRQVIALTDVRDNNTYAVAKHENGLCWMIENLRLDAENSSDSTLAEGFGGVFTGLAQSEEADSFTIFDNIFNEKYTEENITGDNINHRIPKYNNSNTRINDSSYVTSPGGADAYGEKWAVGEHNKWLAYGNYYNWPAAMASTEDYRSDSEDTGTSICPKGWHLPAYYDRYEFSLFGSLTKNWVKYPHNFTYSGSWVYNGSTDSRGNTGVYLSSSTDYVGGAITPMLTKEWEDEYSSSQGKVYGYSVRCLADY